MTNMRCIFLLNSLTWCSNYPLSRVHVWQNNIVYQVQPKPPSGIYISVKLVVTTLTIASGIWPQVEIDPWWVVAVRFDPFTWPTSILWPDLRLSAVVIKLRRHILLWYDCPGANPITRYPVFWVRFSLYYWTFHSDTMQPACALHRLRLKPNPSVLFPVFIPVDFHVEITLFCWTGT